MQLAAAANPPLAKGVPSIPTTVRERHESPRACLPPPRGAEGERVATFGAIAHRCDSQVLTAYEQAAPL